MRSLLDLKKQYLSYWELKWAFWNQTQKKKVLGFRE